MKIENINFCQYSIFAHMSIDEALLENSIKYKNNNIIFRTYSTDPHGITLGRSQKVDDLFTEICLKNKIDVVRRITGGRAVPHYKEITYSLISPAKYMFSGSIADSYMKISNSLASSLSNLGIDVEISRFQTEVKKSLSCFAATGKHEITLKGKKIFGSAQYRKDNYLLQQGTLILKKLPKYYHDIIPSLKGNSLEELLDELPDKMTILNNFVKSLSETFKLDILPRELYDEEKKIALKYLKNRYFTTDWNGFEKVLSFSKNNIALF